MLCLATNSNFEDSVECKCKKIVEFKLGCSENKGTRKDGGKGTSKNSEECMCANNEECVGVENEQDGVWYNLLRKSSQQSSLQDGLWCGKNNI